MLRSALSLKSSPSIFFDGVPFSRPKICFRDELLHLEHRLTTEEKSHIVIRLSI